MAQIEGFIAFIGLIETFILLIYAARYYLFTYVANKTSLQKNVSSSNPQTSNNPPFISVLLPVYNEQNVVDRLMNFCTNFDYKQYEVVVIDDSDDETTDLLNKWKDHSGVKVVHRESRKGWKGGALNVGLSKIDARSNYILILDADFVPPKDLLTRFLKKFNETNATIVQGYQVHDLNTEQNWITKAYRIMFSVSNMVELYAKSKLKLLIPITGSVYMMRTDVLKKMKFEECLTEDWELTLRVYEEGYKIVYDPTLTASAECPDTLSKYFSQNIRWAEGHTRSALRQHFWKMLRSKYLTVREKIDFLFQAGVYLNSVLIIASSLGGLYLLPSLSSVISLPFVLATLFFVVIGLPAVTIASIVALKRENQKQEIHNIPFVLVLGYFSTPVTAYAALKGLFAVKSVFNRTYKTGKVTKRSLLGEIKKLFKK